MVKGGVGDIKFVYLELILNMIIVPDEQVHNATVLFGVTDGSGFAGRLKSCKISQYDIVFGFFMAEDEGYPVIIGLLSPTKAYNKFVESKMNGDLDLLEAVELRHKMENKNLVSRIRSTLHQSMQMIKIELDQVRKGWKLMKIL